MKRKELTRTFMMISNCEVGLPFGLHGFHKTILASSGLTLIVLKPYPASAQLLLFAGNRLNPLSTGPEHRF